MDDIGTFPFGQPVRIVEQADRSPKKVFVLGVYASAVHARWTGADGRTRVQALAVASEPAIFWRGEGAEEVLAGIEVPAEAGRLTPAARRFNGPSGLALDELFLEPLGLTREEAWLCDLVPHSCTNAGQRRAIERAYRPVMEAYGLPEPTVPSVPRRRTDGERRAEILEELEASEADTLILLGDEPIRWFLKPFDPSWKKLSDFGTTREAYGVPHPCRVGDLALRVLPLAHPRQAAQLGRAAKRWTALHGHWVEHTARGLNL